LQLHKRMAIDPNEHQTRHSIHQPCRRRPDWDNAAS
jgi:hypothetical protein